MIKLRKKFAIKKNSKSGRPLKDKTNKRDADTWIRNNLEYLVDNFAGGYVIIVDDKGVIFTDADGKPGELVRKAKKKFPRSTPYFFRVPNPQDFLCALLVL